MKIFGFEITRGKTLQKSGAAFESLHRSPMRGRVAGPAPTDARNEFAGSTRDEVLRISRFFDKRSGLVRGIAQDNALYAIGDGIRPQAATTDKAWNRAAERVFKDWARRATVCGRYSFNEVQHLVSRAIDRDGEVFAVKSFAADGVTPAIQLIEAHRCMSGENPPEGMCDGILSNASGAPLLYRFLQDDGNFVDVPASAVTHVHDPESVTEGRAKPPYTHGLDYLQDAREILGANLKGVKDQLQTTVAVIAPNDVGEDVAASFGDVQNDTGVEMPTEKQINAAIGGASVILPTGSSVQNLTNNLPNPTFQGFMEHLQRQVTSGVLPYEFTQDASKIGGATVRLVVGKADRAFSHRQNIIITRLLDHVWAYVIAHYITAGLLAPSDDFWRVSWVTPRRVTVDAGRDAMANRSDIIAGIKSWSDHYGENGADFEEEMERRADEAAFIIALSKERGVPLRFLYNPAPSTGMIPDIAEAGAEVQTTQQTQNQ